jgi:thioester reductase-like protein
MMTNSNDFAKDFIYDENSNPHPSVPSKIFLINGDIEVDNLRLNEIDETVLIDEVDVIFHCAVSVWFEDPLKLK